MKMTENLFQSIYTPKVKIKDFNVLIDGKGFSDVPIKNKEEAYKKPIEMSKNNDYETGNLMDFEYFLNYYKLIPIDLSKQTELGNANLKQPISFIGKLERNEGATNFFIIEKLGETNFNFSQYKMETQKNINLLSDIDSKSSKFAARKWYVINGQNNTGYCERNQNDLSIKFEKKVIKSSLCDYSDAYSAATEHITATGGNENTKVAFINCAPFTRYVTHINDKHTNADENLDI